MAILVEIVQEPLGAAHRDWNAISISLKDALLASLDHLDAMSTEELLEARYQRLVPKPGVLLAERDKGAVG